MAQIGAKHNHIARNGWRLDRIQGPNNEQLINNNAHW